MTTDSRSEPRSRSNERSACAFKKGLPVMIAHRNRRRRDRYLSLAQLVTYSSLSLRTLNRHLKDPDHPLPHKRVGGRVLVRISEFDAWIDEFPSVTVKSAKVEQATAEWVRKLAR